MKPLVATVAGALGLGGLLVAGGARPFAPKAETASPAAAAAQPSAGTTTIDCGEGRRALVRTANGATAIQCVAAFPVTGSFADGIVADSLAASESGSFVAVPVHADAIAPAPRPLRVASAPVYRTTSAPTRRVVVRQGRSWKKSAAIVGGAAAAGAGVGAVLDGGSGAKKGAVVGLLGGTIYDIATRNR